MNGHGDKEINEARFSNLNKDLLATSGGDGYFRIWDMRDYGHKNSLSVQASDTELNCCAWNHINEFLVATGGDEDGSVAIWDLRKTDNVLNDFDFHKQQVTAVEWHPGKE